MTDIKIAAAYVRVSTDDQTELSPASQLSVLREYAEKNGYVIPEQYVFIDEGISGRKVAKRPGFNRMIATAKASGHPFDCILVWKFSRFARNQEESIVYKAMLRKDNVDVISISEPLADGPFGSLIERILEWMDEYYSIRLSGEVKRSMTLNAQRGHIQTIAAFGYRYEEIDGKNKIVPDPNEAPYVRQMYEHFIAGEGLSAIAKWLNSLGVRTHRGTPMENRTVEYILRNPLYMGKVRWTPTGRTRRNFDNPDSIIADGTHEAIVDADTWEAAQKRMRAVKEQWGYKARPTYELKDWLGGIVRCSECGSTLIFSKPHFFKCNNYVRGRCKSTQHISVEKLHDSLLEKLNEDLHGSELLPYKLSVTSDNSADEVRRLELALDALDRKLQRIRDAYASGVDTLEDYARYRAEIDSEKEIIRQQIQHQKKILDPVSADQALRTRIADAIKVMESVDSTKEQKNNAARSIIHTCTFCKDTMHLKITYRISI